MRQFQLHDKAEVEAIIQAAVASVGRRDTPFSFGVVPGRTQHEQLVYFDLPRLSPLQFNISTDGITTRQQLIEQIKAAILQRLESD